MFQLEPPSTSLLDKISSCENSNEGSKTLSVSVLPSSCFFMSQTLNGHEINNASSPKSNNDKQKPTPTKKRTITKIAWNPTYMKFASADTNGLIIVWQWQFTSPNNKNNGSNNQRKKYHDENKQDKKKKKFDQQYRQQTGYWCEEMINHRDPSSSSEENCSSSASSSPLSVVDMKWSSDGRKIGIIYSDGVVIVGSVDGNRLWGKEILRQEEEDDERNLTSTKNENSSSFIKMKLKFVEWNPNGKEILFVTIDDQILVYNEHGEKINTLTNVLSSAVMEREDDYSGGGKKNHNNTNTNTIVGIHWHHHHNKNNENETYNNSHSLAIAFENGQCLLLHNVHDLRRNPIVIDTSCSLLLNDTKISLSHCQWNTNGSIVALGGRKTCVCDDNMKKKKENFNQIFFYTSTGMHVQTITLPHDEDSETNIRDDESCRMMSSLTWESNGLRLAVTLSYHNDYKVKSLKTNNNKVRRKFQQSNNDVLYFINIRPNVTRNNCLTLGNNNYHNVWTKLQNQNVIVYTKTTTNNDKKQLHFWNYETEEHHIMRQFQNVSCIRNMLDYFLVVSFSPGKCYNLMVCDSVGYPIMEKEHPATSTHAHPILFITSNSDYIVYGDEKKLYIWNYSSVILSPSSPTSQKEEKDSSIGIQTIDIEMLKNRMRNIVDGRNGDNNKGDDTAQTTQDKICSICISRTQEDQQENPKTCVLYIAQESGILHKYKIPNLILVHTFNFRYLQQARQASHQSSFPPQIKLKCIDLNCNDTKMSVITSNYEFFIIDLRPNNTSQTTGQEAGQIDEQNINSSHTSSTTTTISLEISTTNNKNNNTIHYYPNVWDVKWSNEDPSSFAIMQTHFILIFSKLFNDDNDEEGNIKPHRSKSILVPLQQQQDHDNNKPLKIPSFSYLSEYEDMRVVTISMDDFLFTKTSQQRYGYDEKDYGTFQQHHHPQLSNKIINSIDTQPISKVKDTITKYGLEYAFRLYCCDDDEYNNTNQNATTTKKRKLLIYNLFQDWALTEDLNLKIAEAAFVKCKNYRGISFVKSLIEKYDKNKVHAHNKINGNLVEIDEDDMKQEKQDLLLLIRAEILTFQKKYDEAEKLYIHDCRRYDLAIQLNEKLGDWIRVVQLVNECKMNNEQQRKNDLNEYSANDTDTDDEDEDEDNKIIHINLDKILLHAWKEIGNKYSNESQWSKAASYYFQGNQLEKAMDCYFRVNDIQGLEKILHKVKSFLLVGTTNDKKKHEQEDYSSLLKLLCTKFELLGMCEEAVTCLLLLHPANDQSLTNNKNDQNMIIVKSAFDICKRLNDWEATFNLQSRQHWYDTDTIRCIFNEKVDEEVQRLLSDDTDTDQFKNERRLKVVELYHKTKRYKDAAQLLSDMARELCTGTQNQQQNKQDYILAKKLYILAALEVNQYRQYAFSKVTKSTIATSSSSPISGRAKYEKGGGHNINNLSNMDVLDEWLDLDEKKHQSYHQEQTQFEKTNNYSTGINILNKAWSGAAACHYFLLAHSQLYNGDFDSSMKTLMKCLEYAQPHSNNNILGIESVLSLICLTSFHNKCFGLCSKVLMRLETLFDHDHDEQHNDNSEVKLLDSQKKTMIGQDYQSLSCSIFTKYAPKDLPSTTTSSDSSNYLDNYELYLQQGQRKKYYHTCTISGRAIYNNEKVIQCKQCLHYILEEEFMKIRENDNVKSCPLCYFDLELNIDNEFLCTIMSESEDKIM